MDLMQQLNSLPMFLISGGVVLCLALFCLVYLCKSYRAGIAMGMDKAMLRRAITSSATFTLLPSVSILLGVIALSGSLGVPLPWLRLSVIGALHYEGNVADIAARATGMTGGLGSAPMTASAFVTIALVMTAGILLGAILCVFLLKRYLNKVQKPKEKSTADAGKKPFGDVVFTAMFIGLVSAYLGSYLGEGTSAGNWTPLLVAGVSAASMAVFEYFARVKKQTWLDNFSMAGSMLIGMAAAVLTAGL
ncbi:MAG: DUF5058 family protein [Ruthenibacterium sp.]